MRELWCSGINNDIEMSAKSDDDVVTDSSCSLTTLALMLLLQYLDNTELVLIGLITLQTVRCYNH